MRLPIGYALAYPDRIGTAVRPDRLGRAAPPRLRAARHGDVPLPGLGLRGRPAGWHCAGVAQRRQRGCGRGVPRRADPLDRDRRGCRRSLSSAVERSADSTVDDIIAADARARQVATRSGLCSVTDTYTKFRNEVMAGGAGRPRPRADRRRPEGVARGLRRASPACSSLLALWNIWAFVFVVGLLISIFLHELGHFVTARWTGHEGHPVLLVHGPEAVELPPRRDRVRPARVSRSARSCASSG